MGRFFPAFISGWGAAALLVARVVMGLAFILHGWPKIQNPMSWMNAMGGENVPSFLRALAALGIVCQMLGALFLVHFPMGHRFVASGGPSYELPLVYLTLAILLL